MFRFFPAFFRGSLGDSCNVGLAGLVFAQQQVVLDARKDFLGSVNSIRKVLCTNYIVFAGISFLCDNLP